MNIPEPIAADIDEAFSLAARWPLAGWRAWDHGRSRTSQLRAAHALIAFITVLVWGGNKSGKTELNLALGAAYCLGGDHPAVIAFLRGNGLPLDLIPPGPGTTWFLAPTHDDSKRYHRARVGALLGVDDADDGWRRRYAGQEASLEVGVPGYSRKARVVFKAHSQGVKGMKGDKIRYLGVDEACPEPMYNQAKIRLSEEVGGRCVFSMTHDVHGSENWVKPRFIDKGEPGATEVQIINADNPHVPAGALEMMLAGQSDVERAAALTGAWGSAHGLCYGEYQRGIHVIPARPVPEDWPRYEAFDYGWNNPNVILTAALSPDNVLEVYREHYQARIKPSQVGEIAAANAEEADETIIGAWGDPSALQANEEAGDAARITILPSEPRDVETGIRAVNARLAGPILDVEDDLEQRGPPTLLIHDSCVNLLREIPNYRRGPNGKPIKVNDHGCDTLRYLVLGVDGEVGFSGDIDLGGDELHKESEWNL